MINYIIQYEFLALPHTTIEAPPPDGLFYSFAPFRSYYHAFCSTTIKNPGLLKVKFYIQI